MAQRALPGIGLIGFWDLGFDGWKVENDGNLRILSALVQASVLSIVAATPGAPVDGDMHIFSAAHPTDANKIAIRDDGAWVLIVPREGAWVYDQATDRYYRFTGAAWVAFVAGGKYRVGFSIESVVPISNEVLLRHVFTTAATFADDFAGSQARLPPAGANPGTAQVFTISLNGAGVGSLTISTAGVITFVTTGGALACAIGDELKITAPAAPDANIVGVSVTLIGQE